MIVTEDWPAGFDPATAPVYTRNEIRTSLPAEQLWPALISATDWPRWYPHAAEVSVAGGGTLADGARFTWKTLNVRVDTRVTEFEPARRLAWIGTTRGARGCHRWIFTPTGDGGCLVVTEEIQVGMVPRLLSRRLRQDLHANHQQWLEGLVEVSLAAPS